MLRPAFRFDSLLSTLCVAAAVLAGACGESDASPDMLGVSQGGASGFAPIAGTTAGATSANAGNSGSAVGVNPAAGSGGGMSPAMGGMPAMGIAGSRGAAGTGAAAAGSGAPAAGSPATAGSSGAAGSSTTPPGDCTDMCAVPDGVAWACKLRFMYGVNYAWHTFAADFGGNKAWNQPGVSAEPAVASELATMAAGGIQVIRWWLWPDFRGDGVTFDASDTPTGLGGTALADLSKALELAEQHNLYLMLTIFSFDNFRPTRMESQLKVRGITPIVTDEAKRRALMDNVVAPLAKAVEASPNAKRMIAWDIINEPEWAITGASLYGGDPVFDPQPDLAAVTHAQMETFLADAIKAVRANSKALVTVGATAVKWKSAWSKLDLDFHQFHMYDWINMYWPYDKKPADYMLDDKPVVMGEFPMAGLMGVSYTKLVESWFGNQYAGALGWAYTDMMFSGNRDLSAIKAFADQHPCETKY